MGIFGRFKAPKGTISVTLDKSEYSIKEPLTGKIDVSAAEDFDVDEIRLELWVTEFTKATQILDIEGTRRSVTAKQENTLHKGKITVSGRMHVEKGFNQDFPFSVNLPLGVPPTYHGHNARNTWKMKGVIAIKGRPDITSHEIELQINP